MATAFQADAFQNNAFQIDAAVVNAAGSRGGAWYYDENVEHARQKAWRAAEAARSELRQTLAKLIDGKPAEAQQSVTQAEKKLVQVADVVAKFPQFLDVRGALAALATELRRYMTARNKQRLVAGMIERAEQLEAMLVDDDDAIIAILMAGI